MNIKIDYKNKLHSIGKDNHSLQQISDAIKIRYPGEFVHGVVIAIIDNGNLHQVKSFEEIVNFWKTNGSAASVKIKVFEAPENSEKKEEQKQFILDNADPVYTASVYGGSEGLRGPESSDVFEVQDLSGGEKEKLANPFLKNKELDQSMEVKRESKVEEEKKEGDRNGGEGVSIEIINQIVEERVRAIIKELDLVTRAQFNALKEVKAEIRKEQEKSSSILSSIQRDLQQASKSPEVKPRGELKPQVKEYRAKFTYPPLNVVKAEPGSKYHWKVDFTNSGSTVWPKSLSVYKTSNKIAEIVEVKSLHPGESHEITIDLIAPSSKGSESRQFRLGYIDEVTDSLTFFGPKFGFQLETSSANVSKPEVPNLIHENKSSEDDTALIKKIIEAAKYVSNQKHSIKVLTKSIKEFGLDENTNRDTLIDIIIQLQSAHLY